MKLWELRIEEGFDVLYTNSDNIKQIMGSFTGKPKAYSWEAVELITVEEGLYGDIISYSKSPEKPVFTSKATGILEDLIKDSVEILPVRHQKYDCFVINIVDVVDCLDYQASKFSRWGVIEKYCIIEERVRGHNIFLVHVKDRKTPSLIPLVSDEFRERVLNNGLKGLKFKLAWDSDSGDQKTRPYAEKNPLLRIITKKDFEEHIQKYLGPVTNVIQDSSRMLTEADLYHIGPNMSVKANTVITKGNSYFKMNAPSSVDSAYAELILHLPSDWKISGEIFNDNVYGWPLSLIKDFGRKVMRQGFWLGQWFVFPNQPEAELRKTYAVLFGTEKFDFTSDIQPYSTGTDYCGVIITPPLPVISGIFKMKYLDEGKPLEGEWPVYFHTLLPLYKSEIIYYFKEGREKFVQKLMELDFKEIFDLNRKNIC